MRIDPHSTSTEMHVGLTSLTATNWTLTLNMIVTVSILFFHLSIFFTIKINVAFKKRRKFVFTTTLHAHFHKRRCHGTFIGGVNFS